MEAVLKNISLKIDKSDWQTVSFGDVVTEPRGTVKDLEAEGIEHVVGLEHIDPEDIHLRRSAGIEDSTTFTKKFEKGDVLFGRRRAYLKKAAQTPFGGICSGDITVMRAKKEFLPELLPFVVNNDKFFDYAVKHSAGGLSPRVKFKDLANYQFLLPPKDQQARLASLLWAMDEMMEREVSLRDALNNSLHVQIENEIHGISIFGKTINQILEEAGQHLELIELKKLGEFLKGRGITKSEVIETGIPCVRYGELYTLHDRIIRKYGSCISEESKTTSLRLKKHDVLFAGSGETITDIGKSAAFIDDHEAYAGGDILIFRPYDMDGTYLGYLMNSQLVRQQLNKYGTGATVMHIYNSDLAKIMVPNISRDIQEVIGTKLELVSRSLFDVSANISASKALLKSLINQIF